MSSFPDEGAPEDPPCAVRYPSSMPVAMPIAALLSVVPAAPQADQGVEELGKIRWRHGFEQALAESERTRRPALVLFDEVPGCDTVKRYGRQVLSHPLIVEAAESLFVPVLVYNNRPGPDRAVLESFSERAWNNPVVRILDGQRNALAPRVAGDYTAGGLAAAMVEALSKAGSTPPGYLQVLAAEGRPAQKARATFSMYCFWSGEVAIGGVDGVVSTQPGFLDGHEVVQATFDPAVVSYDALVRAAKSAGQASSVYTHDASQLKIARGIVGRAAQAPGAMRYSAKDDKYQLKHALLRFVPMTVGQATKVNAALGRRSDPRRFLSAGQLDLYRAVKKSPRAGWSPQDPRRDFVAAFAEAQAIAAKIR